MRLEMSRFLLFTIIWSGGYLIEMAAAATYHPIPPGYDFPADEGTLLKYRDTQDVAAMRTHAWMVFAGMTQPAEPTNPNSEAIWETWHPYVDAFKQPGPTLQGMQELIREFVVPRQLTIRGPHPENAGVSLSSFTLFDQQTIDHIRNNHYDSEGMNKLNGMFPSNGDVTQRKIIDFPREAMSVKTVWMPVSKTGLTAIPVWDFNLQDLTPQAPPQTADQFKRMVAVDPSRTTIPRGEKKDLLVLGKTFNSADVVSLNAFYHFQIKSQEQVDALTGFRNLTTGQPPVIGDYMVLMCLHYTTKEIPNWIWATFWWHDAPDTGPFAADRPDTTKLILPWRNYLMNVAYDAVTPKEADGSPHICFNPYIEPGLTQGVPPSGVVSNCMACHQQARWQDPTFKVTRGLLPDNDPIFTNTTKTDFVWAVTYETP
jgi:hypothetical protein